VSEIMLAIKDTPRMIEKAMRRHPSLVYVDFHERGATWRVASIWAGPFIRIVDGYETFKADYIFSEEKVLEVLSRWAELREGLPTLFALEYHYETDGDNWVGRCWHKAALFLDGDRVRV
jgi:hypothetical protein